MISNDNQRASAKAVCDVWLISTADSKTEGCTYYWQRPSVVTLSLVHNHPAVVDEEINTAIE